ncbi:MAG: acyl carrier protein [Planctomycetes bacterium]|nr:acyl carrier protein [Planctomycetota bacterium]
MEALIDELKRHIVAELELTDVDPEQIDSDQPLFVEGLGLDSLDAVELVVMLERHYAIQLTDMATARAAFATPRTLAEFVQAHRG